MTKASYHITLSKRIPIPDNHIEKTEHLKAKNDQVFNAGIPTALVRVQSATFGLSGHHHKQVGHLNC